jgi:hypothetical protein
VPALSENASHHARPLRAFAAVWRPFAGRSGRYVADVRHLAPCLGQVVRAESHTTSFAGRPFSLLASICSGRDLWQGALGDTWKMPLIVECGRSQVGECRRYRPLVAAHRGTEPHSDWLCAGERVVPPAGIEPAIRGRSSGAVGLGRLFQAVCRSFGESLIRSRWPPWPLSGGIGSRCEYKWSTSRTNCDRGLEPGYRLSRPASARSSRSRGGRRDVRAFDGDHSRRFLGRFQVDG